MAKGKQRRTRDDASTSSGKHQQQHQPQDESSSTAQPTDTANHVASNIVAKRTRSLYQWCLQERQGIIWVIGCAFMGSLFGFGIGSGLLTGEGNRPPNAWRIALGARIRSTGTYQVLTFKKNSWEPYYEGRIFSHQATPDSPRSQPVVSVDPQVLRSDPSHPTVYAVLREAVVREKGGYVHPDLGILSPAPSGAARGLGMVRDDYHRCQTTCIPGIAEEKRDFKNSNRTTVDRRYMQEEVLIKVPLAFQMTRSVAMETLLPRISAEVQKKANVHELDDAALLTLLLAHERGVGKYSRWLPYIASLPLEPSCGFSKKLRPYLLDSIHALREELGLDVSGWPGELLKATQYAERITNALVKDYGSSLQHPKDVSAQENIEWALCQVASRAIAGSQKHGSLRLIPLADILNHDSNAAGFVELTGKERLDNGQFLDATTEEDSGAFVVRSRRHGRRKALKVGQELLVNYNVPHYSPFDWFVSVGFVPPERWGKWQKIESALPRIRRDGPFGTTEYGNSGNARSATGRTSRNNQFYQQGSGVHAARSSTEL
eukprot:scaffold345_cov134-Cylindrotheca_fusiformis.AAC.84